MQLKHVEHWSLSLYRIQSWNVTVRPLEGESFKVGHGNLLSSCISHSKHSATLYLDCFDLTFLLMGKEKWWVLMGLLSYMLSNKSKDQLYIWFLNISFRQQLVQWIFISLAPQKRGTVMDTYLSKGLTKIEVQGGKIFTMHFKYKDSCWTSGAYTNAKTALKLCFLCDCWRIIPFSNLISCDFQYFLTR